MTDTTRKDMVGCYGNKKMITPNLDALAQEGIRYENAYTCQPVCGPARSAIFTGTFPHTNGMVTNGVPLGANVKTIGQRLTDNGIKCGYIGKWHLDGGDYFGLGCCPEGWDVDYWYDMRCYLNELSEEQRRRSRQPEESYQPDFSEGFTYAHRCSDRAIKFLEQYKEEDFFLTVSYDEPHGPSLCPAPYNSMYKDFKFESSAKFTDTLDNKPLMQRLWAGDIYEEVVNIPLIIKGGERGKVVTAPASHIDIAPTVMEYFELPIPKLLEGKSMLPQIYDTTLKINSEVYTEFTRYEIDHDGFGGLQIMRGVISENYKLAFT